MTKNRLILKMKRHFDVLLTRVGGLKKFQKRKYRFKFINGFEKSPNFERNDVDLYPNNRLVSIRVEISKKNSN